MRIRKSDTGKAIKKDDQQIALVANALAHPLRVALVRYLIGKNGGKGVDNITCNKDLVDLFNYSQSTMSQHIKILKESGLFKTKIENKFTLYNLDKQLLKSFRDSLKF